MNRSILAQCIKEKPKLKLKECLSKYDNTRLIALAEKQHLVVNMGRPIDSQAMNKKILLDDLYNRIYYNFKKDLFYLPPREIEFVRKLMNTDFNVADNIDYQDCSFLHALGYIHLYNYKGQIYPIIPQELRRIYNDIPEDELEAESGLNNNLYEYAIGLTQIHGIYSIEHFVEVWNAYNTNKIEFDEALRYLDMMYDRQNYFNFDYQYVVTNYPSNDEGYKLLEINKDKIYQIPKIDEIKLYSKKALGDQSPYLKKLAKLI